MHTVGNGQRVTVCCVTDFHEAIFARGGGLHEQRTAEWG